MHLPISSTAVAAGLSRGGLSLVRGLRVAGPGHRLVGFLRVAGPGNSVGGQNPVFGVLLVSVESTHVFSHDIESKLGLRGLFPRFPAHPNIAFLSSSWPVWFKAGHLQENVHALQLHGEPYRTCQTNVVIATVLSPRKVSKKIYFFNSTVIALFEVFES
ncbi:uncharacterized protein LACBIDRAFT_321368 [Laccaria bicolor S238N-H82]|uniref:Predicted protein n=1 Tax=Laccaria bicolor (strain S238N-H82 / ATCC MYA-4686) TaxID=486041 RepID=B0CPY8_LACBS|nr:uncharacterized protein LACBIDRAFT_321368 [Laccaria bicolor S238N-H82]EDR15497.1 predicted protein [Laccaria bicolor S238N-H82]|eukprot:XP_001873705.1 predicted protein [Laccaria bicolor S238N-H82]